MVTDLIALDTKVYSHHGGECRMKQNTSWQPGSEREREGGGREEEREGGSVSKYPLYELDPSRPIPFH